MFIKYCEKVNDRSGKNLFWSIQNSGEILDKLKARDFNATSLSTYDFSTLCTTLHVWPLGSSLWCLTVSLSLSHWYPGSGVVLDCIDS